MEANQSSRKRLVKLSLGVALIAVVGLGSILAANITLLKPNSTSEFGQGVYKIKACDSFIRMDLVSGTTGELGAPSGLSPLTGISISSLDSKVCKGTTFTVNAYDTTAQQTPLYRTDGQVALCRDVLCTPGSNSQNDLIVNIDATGAVSLGNPDNFHSISFDADTGVYKISIVQPTILANEVGRLTIQSAKLAA
jgi:hypothetical protein